MGDLAVAAIADGGRREEHARLVFVETRQERAEPFAEFCHRQQAPHAFGLDKQG